MNAYLLLKWLHVLSATILMGTGIGIAYFKWSTDRTGDVRAIRLVNERTVWADWIFTSPAVVLQPVTGFALAQAAHFPLLSGWVGGAIALYLLAGLCWLIVLRLQWRMRELARAADTAGTALPPEYAVLARRWFCLGIPAFLAMLGIYGLMVFKPAP